MKAVRYILLALLLMLQYALWFGDGSVPSVWHLHQRIRAQKSENLHLRERNDVLIAEVLDLKHGLAAIEERARAELGMVKKGETFFQVIEDPGQAR
jgi:cell division protein FtsB